MVIPDEDPQCTTDDFDDDEDPVGEGIGEEDGEQDDGDEVEDEPVCVDSGRNSGSRKRRPLPAWLLQPFKAKIEESKRRDANRLPPLYAELQTFWFPQKATFFILQKPDVSPPDLYNPQFFLWDPEALCSHIPCPNCQRPLHRHTHISHPRRCVDADSTFWMLGYCYRCRWCINSKSGRNTLTFRSWDPRILQVLPPHLAAEFPVQMSYRTAMSNTLFSWMRSCFQNGMGSKQFCDALRVQHLLSHDKLQLHHGRHGFTPSSPWLRDMYCKFIEQHQHVFNQHMAMLTAEICAIDHSHKITKHIARVDGEQVFTALLMVTNEKGQIRAINFVATKSHSQFELALVCMWESLVRYGHLQPKIFFTAMPVDRQFLENVFASLCEEVVPVEKYAHLEPFDILSAMMYHKMMGTSSLVLTRSGM
ncbi:hypothetical protein K443DRAFT_127431 [Laccaria amethystina LaAM-08-1]|uniref:DUF6729 domain-containing protein n=1 Tax=Laccaria amethystina LaAM-08-1 TaxID=1095629 RepID=A0A0C9XB73_9AGAR|nr:hypothetical protein K443DRAFT_127431 [Laccaria amethystina LaAM-08-1]